MHHDSTSPSRSKALPSKRVRELIRQGAELALGAPPEWLEQAYAETLATNPIFAVDPALAESSRHNTRAMVFHWAAANMRNPGAPVAPNLGPDALDLARDLVRRGVSDFALRTFRVGQDLAFRRWMQIAFGLTADHDELREMLDVTARSIAEYVDATIEGLSARMKAERDELTRGTHAERREVIALLIDGAPIPTRDASWRLGYELEGTHRAAVVWSAAAETDLADIEAVAVAIARDAGASRRLVVAASAASAWVWVPARGDFEPLALRAALRAKPGMRVALGSLGRGVDGFRRSHLDALTAQRPVARLGMREPLVTYDMIRLVDLVTQDVDAADTFIAHTLGKLATASADLRVSLRAYLEEGCNASLAAARLGTHRNTLLRRLARAEDLLPRPLDGHRTHVAVALEILAWRVARTIP